MIIIREINVNEAKKFLDLVVSVDEVSDFLLFDKSERKRDIELVEKYITKMNENPNSFLLVAEDEFSEFVGYVAGEQPHHKRLQHILSLNIATKRIKSNKNIGIKLMDALAERVKKNGNIHRIEATIVSENKPCLVLAKRIGCVVEGIKKDAIKINDRYYDLVMIARLL